MPYIHIDLDGLDTDDLIEELEYRGFKVIDNDDSGAVSESVKDEIYNLYRDFVMWDSNEIPDNGFVLSLKRFFENHTGKLIV